MGFSAARAWAQAALSMKVVSTRFWPCPPRFRRPSRAAPDQVGAQRHRREPGPVSGQHQALGRGFGFGVKVKEGFRIGLAFVHPEFIVAGEDDTGAAGVDQTGDGAQLAGLDDVGRAGDVAVVIVLPGPPDSGLGRAVEDAVDVHAGLGQGSSIGEVAEVDLDSRFDKLGSCASDQGPDLPAARQQQPHDSFAQEAIGTGDEGLAACCYGCSFSAAHAASSKRWILALWRASTGKSG